MTSAGHPAGRRIAAADLLRGAALFGILSVNIWFFASASAAVGETDPDYVTAADRFAHAATTFLFASKSYLLFAFLFGYSFVLQEQAAQRAGREFVPMMLRRLGALIVLGAAHAVLLYPGDILLLYGLLGFVLLAMRGIDPSTAFRRGAALTVLAGTLLVLLGLAAWSAPPPSTPGAADLAAALARGSVMDVVEFNAGALPGALASVLFVQGLPALGAMLVGLAAARVGFLTDPARQAGLRRRLLPIGSAVGLLGAAVFTAAAASSKPGPVLLGFGVTILTAPLLTATYVVILLAWHRVGPAGVLVRSVSAAGRMALSNYLGQSLLLSLVFTGYGLALMEQVSAVQTVGLVFAIYAVLVSASLWWGRSHRYGPAEWVLRRITYGPRARTGPAPAKGR